MKTASGLKVEEFAVAFTIAVTEVSDSAAELVAKNGIHSIFSVLLGIFPQESAISISTNQILDYNLMLVAGMFYTSHESWIRQDITS
jgi:hypothetical protein